jgi:hypothetical protein
LGHQRVFTRWQMTDARWQRGDETRQTDAATMEGRRDELDE